MSTSAFGVEHGDFSKINAHAVRTGATLAAIGGTVGAAGGLGGGYLTGNSGHYSRKQSKKLGQIAGAAGGAGGGLLAAGPIGAVAGGVTGGVVGGRAAHAGATSRIKVKKKHPVNKAMTPLTPQAKTQRKAIIQQGSRRSKGIWGAGAVGTAGALIARKPKLAMGVAAAAPTAVVGNAAISGRKYRQLGQPVNKGLGDAARKAGVLRTWEKGAAANMKHAKPTWALKGAVVRNKPGAKSWQWHKQQIAGGGLTGKGALAVGVPAGAATGGGTYLHDKRKKK